MTENPFEIPQAMRDRAKQNVKHAHAAYKLTRAQPLLPESALAKAHDFLFDAHVLVTDVRSLFFNGDDFATAARLKDIQGRLADEVQAVERLMAASKRGLRY